MTLPTETAILLKTLTSSLFKLQGSTIALAETSRRAEARALTLQAVLAELIVSSHEDSGQGDLIGRALLQSLDRLRGRVADAGDDDVALLDEAILEEIADLVQSAPATGWRPRVIDGGGG